MVFRLFHIRTEDFHHMWYFTRSNLLGRAGGFTRSFENLHLCPPPTLHFCTNAYILLCGKPLSFLCSSPSFAARAVFPPQKTGYGLPLGFRWKRCECFSIDRLKSFVHRCVANFIFAISYFYLKRFIKNPGGLFYERGRHSLMSLVLSVTGFCPGEISCNSACW